MPTVGTGLVILFATADTVAGRWLRWQPLVAVGLVSYSAYLWHQPLFAFARHRTSHELHPGVLLALGATAVVLAFISWRWVEQPFRDRRIIPRRQIFAGALAGNVALMGVGLGLSAEKGHLSRFSAPVLTAIEPGRSDGSACLKRTTIGTGLHLCEFGDTTSTRTLVLYGDSHADALLFALHSALLREQLRGVRMINEVCHPIPGIVDSRYERDHRGVCPAARTRMLQWLGDNADYTVVMMRWTYRLYPVPGMIDRLLFDNGEGGIESGDEPRMNFVLAGERREVGAAAKQAIIRRFLTDLAEVAPRTLIVYPVPETGWDIPRYNMVRYLDTGRVPTSVTTSIAAFHARNRFITKVLDGVDHPNLTRVKPANLLCGLYQPGRCLASLDGVPLYYDEDHLSNTGAEMIVREIMRSLQVVRSAD